MKFYSVTQYEHGDFARHHGYFSKVENAYSAAIKAVNRVQDEIIEMRKFCLKDNMNYENYKNNMEQIKLVDNSTIAQWVGNYNSVSITIEKTED